jgi:hypothetical protein
MEYTPSIDDDEKPPFDMEKANYINQMGQVWVGADCGSFAYPEQCTKLSNLAKNYGAEFFATQNQLEKCFEMLEDDSNTAESALKYSRCLESAQKSLSYLIDSYYDQFKKNEFPNH